MAHYDTLSAVLQNENEDAAGKYLTFVLEDESYGLEILKVREIIGLMAITPVPKTPDYIKGIVNLRGKVIPVVDLRLKFGLEEVEATDETCIIVIDLGSSTTGILVDTVDEVLDIGGNSIEDSPDFGSSVDTEYILGIAKTDGGVKLLLDIDKALSSSDILKLHELSKVSE